VQLQSEPTQSFSEHRQHALRILSMRKQHHKVVAEPNQCTRTPQTRSHHFGEPFIHDVMKINVTQDREITEPCGVPASGKWTCPDSNTPAVSHLSISLRTTPSVTRLAILSLSVVLGRLSKNFRMSTSTTQ
jgi:hypothetical protein